MRQHFHTVFLIAAFCLTAVASAATAAEPSAGELLQHARDHRAVWNHFPGFTADATVRIDGQTERGTVAVDQHGAVTAKISDGKLRDWFQDQLGSVVDHRLPSVPDEEAPAFADEQTGNPLGRLIRLGDAKMESAYRIRDNMITEVNRREGAERFTISVTDVQLNKEDKYLPRSFSVTVWDTDSGQIKSTSFYLNEWKRIGAFDLPERLLEVESSPAGQQHVQEFTLGNYQLTEKSK